MIDSEEEDNLSASTGSEGMREEELKIEEARYEAEKFLKDWKHFK